MLASCYKVFWWYKNTIQNLEWGEKAEHFFIWETNMYIENIVLKEL